MGVNYFRNKRCADKSLGSLSQDDIRLQYLIIEIELSNLSTTVERVFFGRIYYSRFSQFELHSRKFQCLIFYVLWAFFRVVLVVFRVFAVFCRHCFLPIREKYMRMNILVGHSRTIDAREKYTFYSTCVYGRRRVHYGYVGQCDSVPSFNCIL